VQPDVPSSCCVECLGYGAIARTDDEQQQQQQQRIQTQQLDTDRELSHWKYFHLMGNYLFTIDCFVGFLFVICTCIFDFFLFSFCIPLYALFFSFLGNVLM